jgi:hypothetical protein
MLLTVLILCAPAAARSTTTRIPLVVEHGVLFMRAFVNGLGPMLFVFVIRGAFQTLRGDPQQLDPTHDLRLGAIAGSIGPDVLRRYAVEVDYAHRTIAFTALAGFRVPAGVLALPIDFDAYGLPKIPAAVDGVRGEFEVDVRAPQGLLFTPFARRAAFLRRYGRERPLKRSGLGVQYAVRSVSVGGRTFRNLPMWFSTGNEGKFASKTAAGLLGNDLLSHFTVTFDYRDRIIILSS